MTSDVQDPKTTAGPRWKQISAAERRVLGVLVEKAKTTPENYPLSLNALRAGCNQKNNRFPQTQLEEAQVEEALDSLRGAGAVLMVQGDSRVDRYRHLAYEWLGVDKVEMAVMAELLLRGSQTVGELRGRAARMEPIKDLGELQPILRSLVEKRLITYLSPAGRGAVVTHLLYLDREMEKVRREAGALVAASDSSGASDSAVEDRESPPPRPAAAVRSSTASVSSAESNGLADDVHRLRLELGELRQQLEATRAEFDVTTSQLREQLDDLNRQLGNA
jgi:uncharacterized protein YceH (UPF0502 family)